MLIARQRAAASRMPPLGEPPITLTADVASAWRDIAAAVPIPLISADALAIGVCARLVADWRTNGGNRSDLRAVLRHLGDYFVPMHGRRALLFNESADLVSQ